MGRAGHFGTSAAKDNIVSELKALSAKRLTPCLSLVIEETADYLFALSTSSRLDQKNQDQCYQAFLVLQSASKTIVSEIAATISERRHSARREERQASTLTAITPSHTNPNVSAVMRFAGSFKIKMATNNCKVGPT